MNKKQNKKESINVAINRIKQNSFGEIVTQIGQFKIQFGSLDLIIILGIRNDSLLNKISLYVNKPIIPNY